MYCMNLVVRKKLTEEEMAEVEAKIADLQAEIEEDHINDENVDDQFEMMIQTTLTVSFKSDIGLKDLGIVFSPSEK